ncbi:serine hydroxymethyltransferase [Halogranum amylolyticum]|uniref:Serine hydroxymethyltransferase n=1 Tax=Halogranum amylolyticum TaxID=660520 RepID=A0A1H8UDM2_9EURY|nr:serine hydroxymethyltransferase [Halogranum amylolyticum]SEP00954.1 serine hydroxymethyltransferase [Halogranum amylolyticum]
MVRSNHLEETDPAVYAAVQDERRRQEESLGLIASENHVSEAVLEAQGSVLTNKYAEGYPGSRYYGGCEHADTVEQLAIDRAKELFDAEHANVQPHSGTQANMGVYFAMLDPGDRILSLDLTHGGHLSHGHDVNFSGQLYDIEQYGVDPDSGYINYESVAEHATEFDPDLVVSGASAYPREFDYERIHEIASDVDAYHLADIAHVTGLIAAGVHTNPISNADFVTASTHKTIRAGRGGLILTSDEFSEQIDKSIFPGSQGGPLMHNIAGKAVGFQEALTPEFTEYAKQVVANAETLATTFSEHGLSLVSGGTDKHYVLADLRDSHPNVTGSDAEEYLQNVGITVNKNTVPGETRSPFTTSGIRVGTPSLTTRGFTQSEMETVGHAIVDVIEHPEDQDVIEDVSSLVDRLCEEYPIYD